MTMMTSSEASLGSLKSRFVNTQPAATLQVHKSERSLLRILKNSSEQGDVTAHFWKITLCDISNTQRV